MAYKKIGQIVLSIATIAILAGCDSKKDNAEQAQNQVQAEQIDANEQDPSTNIVTNDNDIELVRNGVNSSHTTTLTVGQAFEHWKGCSNPQWTSKTGDRGERMVVFKCQIDNYMVGESTRGEDVAMIFNTAPEGIKIVDADLGSKLKNIEEFVIFNIGADENSFQVASSATKINFKDGKSYISESTNPAHELGVLPKIYQNVPFYCQVTKENYDNRQ